MRKPDAGGGSACAIALALASRASVIVTGDPDLLVLDPWRGIRIVKLADFDSVVIPILEKEDLG